MNQVIKLLYPVLSPLIHDNEAYKIGSTVALSADEAEALLEAAVIGEPQQEIITGDGSGETLPPVDEKPIPASVIAQLFALAQVPRGDQPTVKEALKIVKDAEVITTDDGTVIEAKDVKINAALRDEAWDLYLAMPAEPTNTDEQQTESAAPKDKQDDQGSAE